LGREINILPLFPKSEIPLQSAAENGGLGRSIYFLSVRRTQLDWSFAVGEDTDKRGDLGEDTGKRGDLLGADSDKRGDFLGADSDKRGDFLGADSDKRGDFLGEVNAKRGAFLETFLGHLTITLGGGQLTGVLGD
jgi:hypothetical protein